MLVAASVNAREIELSVDNRIGGDSNVFRRRNDRKADGFYELSPQLAVREQNSKLDYDLSYRPSYRTYFETSGIDGFDHRAAGSLEWKMTPIDTVSLTGTYVNVRTLQFEARSGSSGSVPAPEQSDRERVQRSEAQIQYVRMLSPLLSFQASSGFDDFASDRESDLDSRAYSGRLQLQYAMNPKTTIGGSGSFVRRESRGNSTQYSTDTDIWDLGVFVSRLLTPTWTVSAQVGPSFVSSKQIPPPGAVGFSTIYTSDISYFAFASLEKKWRLSKFHASYTRSESRGSGTSASSFVDNVNVDVDHQFDRRWRMHWGGSWTRRKEIASVPGGSREETTTFQTVTTLTRRINQRVSIIGQYSFSNQDYNNNSGSGAESVGPVHTGFLSLRYTFEPIAF